MSSSARSAHSNKSARLSRRGFLATAGAASAALWNPYVFTADAEQALRPTSANDRLRIGAIGMRYQGTVVADEAVKYGDMVAICDVDREIAEEAREHFGGQADLYEDYRALLDRQDIDILTIGTPDHWHTPMVLDGCRAGKDIYCEKPLTLTVDEGKLICEVVAETGAIVQVGTWQRSDERFRLACELVRQGRLGKIHTVTVVLGKNAQGGPFEVHEPPSHLNWDLWLGQAPFVPYIPERCHYTFRWWYEYSGGQMTDWGAHHLDIAQWALDRDESGPVEVEGTAVYPQIEDGYNVAIDYQARYRFDDDVRLIVLDEGRNGVMFEGDRGRIFVNRGTVSGRPVEDLQDDPLPRESFQLYPYDNLARPPRAGKLDAIINHMGNFIDCVRSRQRPLADVASQHRAATLCHLGNISMELGRPLAWNPVTERFVQDSEADRLLSRPQREGYRFSG